MAGFDAYMANPSMYEVHKFMDLDPNEMGYFITQVGMAAASFGVADADVKAVGDALTKLFNYRCSPPATAVKAQGPQLQSICTNEECPLSPEAVCGKYDGPAMEPSSASMMPGMSSTMMPGSYPTMMPSSSMSGMPTPTMSSMPTSDIPTAAAVANGVGMAAVAGGLAAFLI